LDAAIDDAARRLVAGDIPATVVRNVLTEIREPPPGQHRWRLAFGAASVAVSLAATSFMWMRSEEPSPSLRQKVIAPAPEPTVTGEPQQELVRTPLTSRSAPQPVRVTAVSVAPITMKAVEVPAVTVARVEVAAVVMAGVP
jgi:hypothetical protein